MSPGSYLIVDERIRSGINGTSEPRKYIGKLVVEGEPNEMQLPDSADLARFRLTSVKDNELTGTQTASYGIFLRQDGVKFEIDGRPYTPSERRELKLGDVEEWTVESVNGVGPVSHPFHIHVNPFEVVSIEDSQGRNLLQNGPVWRDTIIIRPEQKVKLRTRYEKFTGEFVQHCHILDHEDLGMMELVRISSQSELAAMAVEDAKQDVTGKTVRLNQFRLKDRDGKQTRLDQLINDKTIVAMIMSGQCKHCAEQVIGLRERLPDSNLLVVASQQSEPNPELKDKVYVDPNHRLFKALNCYDGSPQHGLVIMDKNLSLIHI